MGAALPPPLEDLLFVVAAHEEGARATYDVEHSERVRSARHEVADEDESIARREASLFE